MQQSDALEETIEKRSVLVRHPSTLTGRQWKRWLVRRRYRRRTACNGQSDGQGPMAIDRTMASPIAVSLLRSAEGPMIWMAPSAN